MVGSYVAVAGGTEGKIAIVPWSRDEGLGEPEFVDIPIIGEPDATKDDATRTATDVVWVTRFGENSVVAVTTNALFKEYIGPNPAEEVSAGSWPYKSTAYVIDLTSRKITKTGAISDLAVQSVASYGDGFVAASGGQVVVVQADLTISRRFPLAGAGRMAVVGDKAIIESGKYTPAAGEKPLVAGDGHVRLVGLDLHTGGTFEITSTPTGGAFAASVTDIWWAYGAGRRPNTLKHIWGGNVTENSGDFKVEERPMRAPRAGRKGDCVDVRALVRFLENVYATCSSYDKLAIVPIDGGPIAIHDAGGFPVDIATP